jgi:hypothetical protein
MAEGATRAELERLAEGLRLELAACRGSGLPVVQIHRARER